jgi:hypothetical protein
MKMLSFSLVARTRPLAHRESISNGDITNFCEKRMQIAAATAEKSQKKTKLFVGHYNCQNKM